MKEKNQKRKFKPYELPRRDWFMVGIAALSLGGYALYNPGRPKKNLTFESFFTMPGINFIYETFGENPDVIYLPFIQSRNVTSITQNIHRNTDSLEEICNYLYDDYGVHSLLVEGLDFDRVHEYIHTGTFYLDSSTRTPQGTGYNKTINRMLNQRRWDLRIGEDAYVLESIKQYKNKIREYVNTSFTTEYIAEIFDVTITQRNKHVSQEAILCKKEGMSPLIVLYGDFHARGLLPLFKSHQLGYVALLPHGYPTIKFPEATPHEIIQTLIAIS